MAKSNFIELPGCEPIPILYEDRSVLAVDKPRGWMLVPVSWQKTARNLQAAINSSIAARDFWARSRGLKFLRYVHRLDADTCGVLLFAKSPGAVRTYSDLFESRRMEKTYLAIVISEPKRTERGRLVRAEGKMEHAGEPPALPMEWTCRLKLAPDPKHHGRMKVDARGGKPAETHFRILQSLSSLKNGSRVRSPHRFSLVECRPVTGRTHQIRVHLAESGCPVVGDELYGRPLTPSLSPSDGERVVEARVRGLPLGLRAVWLAYADPFTRRRVDIRAPVENFLKEYGFDPLSELDPLC